MRQLVYTTLLLIITLLFTCDEMKICSDIKMSQNIMNMIAELYQNSAQMISGKHQKFWKIVRKTYVVEFPLNRVVRIQSRANYPIALQIHFGSAQKGKDV